MKTGFRGITIGKIVHSTPHVRIKLIFEEKRDKSEAGFIDSLLLIIVDLECPSCYCI